MFVLRSAFWLFLAFMVIRPGFDMAAGAGAMRDGAVSAGQQAILAAAGAAPCTTIGCAGGKAALAMLSGGTAIASPAGTAASPEVPLPRRRPADLG